MTGILTEIRTTLEMIKWEHSIFALPFALTAMLLAAGGLPAVADRGVDRGGHGGGAVGGHGL